MGRTYRALNLNSKMNTDMKDLKFTPGPWCADLDDGFVYTDGDFMKPVLQVRGWGHLSKLHGPEEADKIQRANLTLTAKAPEMFEALKQAKEVIERYYNYEPSEDLEQALETINKLI